MRRKGLLSVHYYMAHAEMSAGRALSSQERKMLREYRLQHVRPSEAVAAMGLRKEEPSPAERSVARLELDAASLADENVALKRTVEDLAHALRKANAALADLERTAGEAGTAAYMARRRKADGTQRFIRRTLDRHGLLRDVDKPEMTQVFREEPAEEGERGRSALALGTAPADWTRYALACNLCGAPAGQACNLSCEDGR